MSTNTTATTPLLNPATDQRRLANMASLLGQTITTPDPTYSKAIIVLDLVWKTFIVAIAIDVVMMSKDVSTKVPLKVWVVGYAALRVLHMIFVCIDYWRWREAIKALFSPLDALNSRHMVLDRVTNCLQFVKSLLNVIWWIIGSYWMISEGKSLADDAPKLFWFTAIFLALDLFTVSIFICVPCITCLVTWCCLLGIQSISGQNVEVEDLTERLANNSGRQGDIQEPTDGVMNVRDTGTPTKHSTSAEDAVSMSYCHAVTISIVLVLTIGCSRKLTVLV
ncbi:hypothetical protein KSS87_010427 [Heliosperma pusillum]|nr:hypothetical protein KSS87_010427 [Heliosperma pusillum]